MNDATSNVFPAIRYTREEILDAAKECVCGQRETERRYK